MELILGGYTRRINDGLYKIEFNPYQLNLGERERIAQIDNPTFLAMDPEGVHLFAILAKDDQGGLIAYAKEDDQWVEKDYCLFSPGPGCHVSYRSLSQTIYVSNYHYGRLDVLSYQDGQLKHLQTLEFEGSSSHPNQDSSHIHYAGCNRSSNHLFICDLGSDMVHTYHIEPDGTLSPSSQLEMPSGFGPRHMVIHPREPYGYIMGELANATCVVSIDGQGKLSLVDQVLNIPEEAVSSSSGAAIRVSQDGRFLYTSNRGHDSITVFKIAEDGAGLEEIQNISSQGQVPRDFIIDPSQGSLLVAHQDSDYITCFERDSESGMLNLTETKAYAPECVCIIAEE